MESSASLLKNTEFHVLIAAAGSGQRMTGSTPKQYRRINGKAILRHTLEAFIQCHDLKSLRVIIDPLHRELYDEAAKGLDLPSPVNGSNTRRSSIYNGIKALSNLKEEDLLLIHDAARPFITAKEVHKLVQSLKHYQAATLATEVTDTLRYSTDGKAQDFVDRSGLWAIQTPQGFHYGCIRKAHEQAEEKVEYTDDTALVSAMGIDVAIVNGHRNNFKITTIDDLDMAQTITESKTMMESRTGSGFDVHAFDNNNEGNGNIRLCGIDIPHNHKLKGHSDADVGLHALTDALLGTISAGDIGQHFPPSDPQWKGVESSMFLKKAVELLEKENAAIIHLDLTLICESPKIGPHREAMQKRVAEICDIIPARVSIKATTTEGLGFTGRGEGIAAQAVATINIPMERQSVYHEN